MDAAPKRYGSLFDSVRVGLCAVDSNGNVLPANSALYRLLRWNPAEWTGQPLAAYPQQTIIDPAQALVWTAIFEEGPAQSIILLTAEAESERICIRTFDEGPGVPTEEREWLSQPRTSSPRPDGDGRGQGLGVSISMSLVKGMGSEPWYEEQESGGHCFCCTLPREDGTQSKVQIGEE